VEEFGDVEVPIMVKFYDKEVSIEQGGNAVCVRGEMVEQFTKVLLKNHIEASTLRKNRG
jgi:hypothetical protein